MLQSENVNLKEQEKDFTYPNVTVVVWINYGIIIRISRVELDGAAGIRPQEGRKDTPRVILGYRRVIFIPNRV